MLLRSSHVAFADEVPEFEAARLDSLGHGQDEGEVAFRDLFPQLANSLVPFEDGSHLCVARTLVDDLASNRLEPEACEVVLEEEDSFLCRRENLALGLLGLTVGR